MTRGTQNSNWKQRQRDWQLKEQEFTRNADVKRRIIARAQQLARSDDFKAAGAEMKQLATDLKAAGFAGKGTIDQLRGGCSKTNAQAEQNAAQKAAHHR